MSSDLKEWQKRVIFEQSALQEKIEKLQMFIHTTPITREDGNLLRDQLYYMNNYNSILKIRISKFKED